MLEAELGTDSDDVGNPMSKGDAVLGVQSLVAGPLTTQVIQDIVADRDVVALREFLLQVVHSGPLGSEATNLPWCTVRSVRIRLSRNGTTDRRDIPLIFVICLGCHVP